MIQSVRAVLICGDGPALSVGGDINSFPSDTSTTIWRLLERMATPFHEAFRVLSRIDAPIVTAAHGAIAGGALGYVYAADLVMAAEGTKFLTAFAALGLSGDGGGTWHLPRLIGARRAAQAYLQNTPIEATEALEWGLINEIVPAEQLRSQARRWRPSWRKARPAHSPGCGHCCATRGTTTWRRNCSQKSRR